MELRLIKDGCEYHHHKHGSVFVIGRHPHDCGTIVCMRPELDEDAEVYFTAWPGELDHKRVTMGELPDEVLNAARIVSEWAAKTNQQEWRLVDICSLSFGQTANINRIKALETQIEVLEAARPHWAKGFTTDGRAAQTFSNALSAIWCILGVGNQTAAMAKLHDLMGEKK